LLEDKKKRLKAKTPSKKSKGKWKEGAHLLHMKNIPTLSHSSVHQKRRLIQRMGALIPKG